MSTEGTFRCVKDRWSSCISCRSFTKIFSVTPLIGGIPDNIREPFRGVAVAGKDDVFPSHEINQDECLDFCELAAGGKAGSHLPAPVAVVRVFPLTVHGFFAVKERDPYRVFAGLVAGTQDAGNFHHHSGGRTAVVGTNKVRKFFRVVMRAEQNDLLLATRFHEDIFHRQTAGGSVGGKVVRLDRAAVGFQFTDHPVLLLCECRRTGGTRPKTDLLLDKFVGAVAVKAAGRFRRRGLRILRIRRSVARDRAHKGRLWFARGFGFAAASGQEKSRQENRVDSHTVWTCGHLAEPPVPALSAARRLFLLRTTIADTRMPMK